MTPTRHPHQDDPRLDIASGKLVLCSDKSCGLCYGKFGLCEHKIKKAANGIAGGCSICVPFECHHGHNASDCPRCNSDSDSDTTIPEFRLDPVRCTLTVKLYADDVEVATSEGRGLWATVLKSILEDKS